MRRCPACNRQYKDDVTVCPVDGEPLGAVTIAAASSAETDPETEVRPRRAQPLERPRFTEIPLERPAPERAAPESTDPAVRATGVPDRVYRDAAPSSPWPIVAGIAIVVAAAAAVLVYFTMSNQSDLATEVGAQITEARVAIADARARLESLPTDSPLRQRLVTLGQWDRQLQQFELSGERTREMSSRAREISSQARQIGEEARAAGATIPTTPPPVVPAEPETVEQPATNTAPEEPARDPMATEPAEPAEPRNAPPPAPETPSTLPGETKPKETPGMPPRNGDDRPASTEVKPPPRPRPRRARSRRADRGAGLSARPSATRFAKRAPRRRPVARSWGTIRDSL
jgi:hypothetical protein